MSKYRPLWEYIKQNSAQRLTFSQIQTILGFQIDHSFLNYKKELEEYYMSTRHLTIRSAAISYLVFFAGWTLRVVCINIRNWFWKSSKVTAEYFFCRQSRRILRMFWMKN